MRFKKGERVLILGNAYGMGIRLVKFPLKAYIYNESRCNIPIDPAVVGAEGVVPAYQHQEYYQIVIDDAKVQRELVDQGYYAPSRWVYPVSLLRRDKYCPVCSAPIETYSEKNLVAEHVIGTERCYGSHSPLEF